MANGYNTASVFFNLDDVNEQPLKNAAQQLGLKGATKPEIIKAWQERYGNATLALMPVAMVVQQPAAPPPEIVVNVQPAQVAVHVPPPVKRTILGAVTVLATVFGVLGALLTAWFTKDIADANKASAESSAEAAKTAGNLYSAELKKARETSEKELAEREETRISGWKELAVYQILTEGMKEERNWEGLTFGQIRKGLTTKAVQHLLDKKVKVKAEDILDEEIQRVLLDLIKSQVVFQTVDDRYMVEVNVVNPNWQEASSQLKIGVAIVKTLDEMPAKAYTTATLREAISQNMGVKSTVFNAVMRELKRQGAIEVSADGKVTAVGLTPKKDK